jgi:hypothetical protein
MDVSEILKEQQIWLDKIRDAAAKKIDPRDAAPLPLDVKKQRVTELQTKVRQLTARKDELVRGYDRAIEASQKQIDYLKQELEQDAVARPAPRPAAPKRRAKPKS